jgi:hypothetical protein
MLFQSNSIEPDIEGLGLAFSAQLLDEILIRHPGCCSTVVAFPNAVKDLRLRYILQRRMQASTKSLLHYTTLGGLRRRGA